jgi:hypothetical protein
VVRKAPVRSSRVLRKHSENGRARPYNGVVRRSRPNANYVPLPAVGLERGVELRTTEHALSRAKRNRSVSTTLTLQAFRSSIRTVTCRIWRRTIRLRCASPLRNALALQQRAHASSIVTPLRLVLPSTDSQIGYYGILSVRALR